MQDEMVKGNIPLMTQLISLVKQYELLSQETVNPKMNQENEVLFKLIDIYFTLQKELKNLDQILNLSNSETHLIEDFKEPRLAISEPENLLIDFEKYLQDIRDDFSNVEAEDKQLNQMITRYNSTIDNFINELTKEYHHILAEIKSGYFENILLKQELEQFQNEIGKKIIDIKDFIKNQPPFYVTVDKINNINQDFYEFRKKWKSIFELIDYARDFKKENMDDIRLNIYLHHKKNIMQAKEVKDEFDVFVRLDVKIEADRARRAEEKKVGRANPELVQAFENDNAIFYKRYYDMFQRIPSSKKRMQELMHLERASQLQQLAYEELPPAITKLVRSIDIIESMLKQYIPIETKQDMNNPYTETMEAISKLKAELKEIENSKSLMLFEKVEKVRFLEMHFENIPLVMAINEINVINNFLKSLETVNLSEPAKLIRDKIKILEMDRSKSPLEKLSTLKELHKQLQIIYNVSETHVLKRIMNIVESADTAINNKTERLESLAADSNKQAASERKEDRELLVDYQSKVNNMIAQYQDFPAMAKVIKQLQNLNAGHGKRMNFKPGVWSKILLENKENGSPKEKFEKQYATILANFEKDLRKVYPQLFSKVNQMAEEKNQIQSHEQLIFALPVLLYRDGREDIIGIKRELTSLRSLAGQIKLEEKQNNQGGAGLLANTSHASHCLNYIATFKKLTNDFETHIDSVLKPNQNLTVEIYVNILSATLKYIKDSSEPMRYILNSLYQSSIAMINEVKSDCDAINEVKSNCDAIYEKGLHYYNNTAKSLDFLSHMLTFCVQLNAVSLTSQAIQHKPDLSP